jgi:sporulation protein YlmC with PRC-barrel domain
MTATAQFTIGEQASCTDGPCGEVRRVVVDPVARTVTHLVIEAKHRSGLARLVPVDLVRAGADGLELSCTLATFDNLDRAEETEFLPGTGGYGYSPHQVLGWPYYGISAGTMGLGMGNVSPAFTYDTLPVGEVGVRRGDCVHALDGEIGKVQGLAIESGSHQVTHVLLQEGHLWGRKEVTIPIGAVVSIDNGIRLNLTKRQVEDLPPVPVDRRGE